MAALALDDDAETVPRGVRGAFGELDAAHRAFRIAGADVHGKGGVHMGIFQHPIFHHIPCAGQLFLGRLEHQLDGTRKGTFIFLQELCRSQQHGGVEIVAAGVHTAVLAGKGQIGLLRDGQSVDISPQQDGFARLAQGDHHPGLAAALPFDAHGTKLAHDPFHSVVQIKTYAGVRVDIPAVFGDLLLEFIGAFQIGIHLISSL